MFKKLLYMLAILLTSCSANKPSMYQLESQKPTPKSFSIESRWAFVLLDNSGKIIKSVVLEVTDTDVKTCESGTKQLKVISENPIGTYPKLFEPAYSITGAAIRISFSPSLCDANYALIGTLTDLGASGSHTPEELTMGNANKKAGGKFYGFPVLK